MTGVNKVILVGNLGKDPEIKYLEGGSVVANLSLATTEAYRDNQGNRIENTEWHDLEMWNGQAKVAEQYLRKGSQVYVEGKIKSDVWQDEQGKNRKRVKIRVISLTMLGTRNQQEQSQPSRPSQAEQYHGGPVRDNTTHDLTGSQEEDDILPF